MTNAYDRLYVENARDVLGSMFHFAVYDLKEEISLFYDMFFSTGLAKRFGRGEPKLTVGMSGPELAYEVIRLGKDEICTVKPKVVFDKTPEYWAGWALAYYQWYSGSTFEKINAAIPVDEIIELYNPLHEADITKFVEIVDNRISSYNELSMLARLRAYAGLTQKSLGEKSGVSVRMIEQYEQGKKELKRASAETVYRLSRALGCEMEELIG